MLLARIQPAQGFRAPASQRTTIPTCAALVLVLWRIPCLQVIEVLSSTSNEDHQGRDEQNTWIVNAEEDRTLT
jgi:hypothetical protein